MRTFITLSFFIFILNIFSQDTIKDDLNILIYKQGRLCQKEFRSSENHIKIVYQYDLNGILIRRWWYDSNEKLISVSLDN